MNTTPSFLETLGDLFGGVLGLTVAIVIFIWALYIAIMWIVLPIFVWKYLKSIATDSKRSADALEKLARVTTPAKTAYNQKPMGFSE